ncbi:oxoglutarate/iron-dependent dioxygenase [Fadolivirus algeromassiliense]|jgi:hypothetical protein|uniref:Oxoglutarate/iron-dependent dioxygenase n=1 Tax=Fadolivirus FV1/VV64 TaxID=3070911 RepID=A0A7D3QW10_9VIRU|nr:oxoglutarate/iron-dependent dioxygenase [Fadolivirus algeromassiliense]QKF94764.1 oxoglutarate/iron-dependent dioxygenase [Fadolivirus FV1/VV64]
MESYDPEPKEAQLSSEITNISFDDNVEPKVAYINKDIIVIDNVLTQHECLQIKSLIDNLSDKLSNGRKKACKKFNNLTDLIMKRCSEHIPSYVHTDYDVKISDHHNDDYNYWGMPTINDSWRLVKCEKGSSLSLHYDSTYVKSVDLKSFYTIMIYLSDNDDGPTHFKKYDLDVLSKQGRLVLFNQKLLHEGLPNYSSEKYFIRSEIMYRRSKSIASESDAEAIKIYNEAKKLYNFDPEKSLQLEKTAFSLSPILETLIYDNI